MPRTQALGWVRSEGIAVDAHGIPQDLTIRSFGVLKATQTPPIEVELEDDPAHPSVNGSDAAFAAVAAAAWRAAGSRRGGRWRAAPEVAGFAAMGDHSSSAEQVASVVDRFIGAIEQGDVEGARGMYADDASVWHNFDGISQTKEQNLRALVWLVRNLQDRRYTDVRRVPFEGGLVQQHVLVGTALNGTSVEMPAMMRIEVRNGKILRIEEYVDPSQAAALTG